MPNVLVQPDHVGVVLVQSGIKLAPHNPEYHGGAQGGQGNLHSLVNGFLRQFGGQFHYVGLSAQDHGQPGGGLQHVEYLEFFKSRFFEVVSAGGVLPQGVVAQLGLYKLVGTRSGHFSHPFFIRGRFHLLLAQHNVSPAVAHLVEELGVGLSQVENHLVGIGSVHNPGGYGWLVLPGNAEPVLHVVDPGDFALGPQVVVERRFHVS